MLLVASSCTAAQSAAAKPKSNGNADNGKRVFASAGCTLCHGAQGQGTALAPQIAPSPVELPALITYVRQPTGKMPPVPVATASDQDLADIFAFLKSVAPSPTSAESLTGNAENGKKLFAAYGCYECHGTVGQGGTGPRIAPRTGSIAYIRKPAAQMPPYTAKVMSDADVADVLAYLMTIPAPTPAKNIALLN